MTRLQKMRRIGPWLLGLFLIAQIAGIVPLVYAHTLHMFEGKQGIADGRDTIAAHEPGGDRAVPGDDDRCCVLHHHLTGVLPGAASAIRVGLVGLRMIAAPTNPLASADPTPHDRPPKLLPLV
jgi:hypothetical protein